MTRRSLQIVLGLLWLLDGGLQLQPFMLRSSFARSVIAPAGDGQPHFVAEPVHWAADLIAAHPIALDIPFAAVQILLGLGMLYPRTAKLAIVASLPWALGVWYFGEGLSGLASGKASLLTGAPGAALLYGVLALAAWPRGGRSDRPAASWLPFAWLLLWVGGAMLQALPENDSGAAVASAIADGSDGAPHWLARADTSAATWFSHHSAAVVALIAVEAIVGLAVLVPRCARFVVVAGLVLALAMWVVPQNFGQITSGQATDPNTAPLVALMAISLLGSVGSRVERASLPEQQRWVRRLGLGFAIGCLSWVAVFATGIGWFIVGVLISWPLAGALTLIYLALSSDANVASATPAESPPIEPRESTAPRYRKEAA